jgi:hypothetical protein
MFIGLDRLFVGKHLKVEMIDRMCWRRRRRLDENKHIQQTWMTKDDDTDLCCCGLEKTIEER